MLDQIDLHGLHVDEALRVLESHLLALGGLNHPGGTLIQVLPVLLPMMLLYGVYILHIPLMHISMLGLLLESLRLPDNHFVEPLDQACELQRDVPASLLSFDVIFFHIWVVQTH